MDAKPGRDLNGTQRGVTPGQAGDRDSGVSAPLHGLGPAGRTPGRVLRWVLGRGVEPRTAGSAFRTGVGLLLVAVVAVVVGNRFVAGAFALYGLVAVVTALVRRHRDRTAAPDAGHGVGGGGEGA